MAEVIRMPLMSDTMTEGVIVAWHKKIGDKVSTGDLLAEVETDKATMDLESPAGGVLLHIGVEEGDAVPVDGVIAVIGEKGEDYKALLDGDGKSKKGSEEESKKAEGAEEKEAPEEDTEEEEEPEEEEDKKEGKPKEDKKPEARPEQEKTSADGDSRLKASPLAKKLAEEKGISLEGMKGSGDNGRIIRRDVENYKEEKAAGTAKVQTATQMFTGEEGYEDVKASQMRKTISRRLSESKFGAPHFYLTMEINMDRAMQARKSINEFLGSKVSFNDMVIKATAAALRRHPEINGSWLGDKLRYYKHIHIGVAMAVEDGLVVPVVRFADGKSISGIAEEIKNYAEKAKSKKLQPTDFEGNTFTISNLGMFGIDEFTAIINPPDACILAVGAIKQQPVVENGQLAIGNIMKVTLSCDHRIVDGAAGARFLQTLKQYLEEPITILA